MLRPRPKQTAVLEALKDKIEELAIAMEKMKLAEYVYLLKRPYRLMYINFLAGIARGLGIAIGFTILGAIVLLILQRIVMLNLPGISQFIAHIVRLVQLNLGP
ncbi:MAG: hypothetical protein C4575_08465 [Desulforudis sp.]|nr:DUF5665 domain-containing protein [Clostridia bacterium]MDQ7792538.1 DUF5665 domain-containing protein [Clostridia bacterium]RJX19496.1 MAG: hypothetical protein C4575_08465 [Desulforudis sp.]